MENNQVTPKQAYPTLILALMYLSYQFPIYIKTKQLFKVFHVT